MIGLGDIGVMHSRAGDAGLLLKALAHPSRLMLLCLMAERERAVGELTDLLGLRQANVSQQLAKLRQEGLVGQRRDGKAIYYHISNQDARRVLEVICDIFGAKLGKIVPDCTEPK